MFTSSGTTIPRQRLLDPLPDERHAPGGYHGGTPIVLVEAENGHTVFFCPYCDKKHRHGLNEDGTPSKGGAAAHCLVDSSPYKRGGYYLMPGPKGCSKPPPRNQRRRVWIDPSGQYRSGWEDKPKGMRVMSH